MLIRHSFTRGESVTGPLTQRLVAALLEENVIPEDSSIDNVDAAENPSNNQTLSMLKNGINIERRVKKELIEQGLLDPDDFQKECEDEILAEIKKVRTELASIAEYNYEELKKLQKAAKEEIKRLEIKRKLDAVDQEVNKTFLFAWHTRGQINKHFLPNRSSKCTRKLD